MSGCEESFLTWNAQYPPLLLREQCIDRERSEDTLPNLLRNVNRSASARVFPHSCYKLSTGWGKADPALRCNNKGGYERFFIRYFLLPRYFHPNNYKFTLQNSSSAHHTPQKILFFQSMLPPIRTSHHTSLHMHNFQVVRSRRTVFHRCLWDEF